MVRLLKSTNLFEFDKRIEDASQLEDNISSLLYNEDLITPGEYKPIAEKFDAFYDQFRNLEALFLVNFSNHVLYARSAFTQNEERKICGILSSLLQFGLKYMKDVNPASIFNEGQLASIIQSDKHYILLYMKKDLILSLFLRSAYGSGYIRYETQKFLSFLDRIQVNKLMNTVERDFFHQKNNFMIQNRGIRAKFIFSGDGAVGKTTLRRKLIENIFVTERNKTIGVDIDLYKFQQKNPPFNYEIVIFDLGGQEIFKGNREELYKGSSAAFLVYDVQNRQTFTNLSKWLEEIVEFYGKIPLVVVANKVDLPDPRVTREEGLDFAKSIKAKFIETSAKTGMNVKEIFEEVGRELYFEECGKIISKFRENTLFPRAVLNEFFDKGCSELEKDLNMGLNASQNLLDLMIFYTPWDMLDILKKLLVTGMPGSPTGPALQEEHRELYAVLQKCWSGYISYFQGRDPATRARKVPEKLFAFITISVLQSYTSVILGNASFSSYSRLARTVKEYSGEDPCFLFDQLRTCLDFTTFNPAAGARVPFDPISTFSADFEPFFNIFSSFLPQIDDSIPKMYIFRKGKLENAVFKVKFPFDQHLFDYDNIECLSDDDTVSIHLLYNKIEESLHAIFFCSSAKDLVGTTLHFTFSYHGYLFKQDVKDVNLTIIDAAFQLQPINLPTTVDINTPIVFDYEVICNERFEITKLSLPTLVNATLRGYTIETRKCNDEAQHAGENPILRLQFDAKGPGSMTFDEIHLEYKINVIRDVLVVKNLVSCQVVEEKPVIDLGVIDEDPIWLRRNQGLIKLRIINRSKQTVDELSIRVEYPRDHLELEDYKDDTIVCKNLDPNDFTVIDLLFFNTQVGDVLIKFFPRALYKKSVFHLQHHYVEKQIAVMRDLYSKMSSDKIIQAAKRDGIIFISEISSMENRSIPEVKKILWDAVKAKKIVLKEKDKLGNQFEVGIIETVLCPHCNAPVEFEVWQPNNPTKVYKRNGICPRCGEVVPFYVFSCGDFINTSGVVESYDLKGNSGVS